MPTWTMAFGVVLATLAVLVGALLVALGLPGLWIFWFVASIFAWWTDFAWVGGGTILALFAMAVTAEVLEFWLGVSSAARVRPSRRVALGTLLGGFLGAFLGAPLLFGLGALVGGLLGTFAGGALAAASEGATLGEVWHTGVAAMKGRWRAFLAKLFLLCTMGMVFLAALFW